MKRIIMCGCAMIGLWGGAVTAAVDISAESVVFINSAGKVQLNINKLTNNAKDSKNTCNVPAAFVIDTSGGNSLEVSGLTEGCTYQFSVSDMQTKIVRATCSDNVIIDSSKSTAVVFHINITDRNNPSTITCNTDKY